MKYLCLLTFLLFLACTKENMVPEGELNIRIKNQTGQEIDRIVIGNFVFKHIEKRELTNYQSGSKMKVLHIPEFYPKLIIGEKLFHKGILFCGTPPISEFEMEGSFRITIKSLDSEKNVFVMKQEPE